MTKSEQLAAIEGLTFSDVLEFFNESAPPRDKDIVSLVETDWGELEVTDNIVSEGDDNGAYVLAWKWVSFEGTHLDKEAADAELEETEEEV